MELGIVKTELGARVSEAEARIFVLTVAIGSLSPRQSFGARRNHRG